MRQQTIELGWDYTVVKCLNLNTTYFSHHPYFPVTGALQSTMLVPLLHNKIKYWDKEQFYDRMKPTKQLKYKTEVVKVTVMVIVGQQG